MALATMVMAFVLCTLLLFTPYTSAGRYEFGDSKVLHIRRHSPSANSTAAVSPTTTSLRTSTSANSSSWQSWPSLSPTMISSRSTSENVLVEPMHIKTQPPIPSEPPDKDNNNSRAPPLPPSVSQDECDIDFGCLSATASSFSQPTIPANSPANGSTPGSPAPLLPPVAKSSKQAACTGLITSFVIFVTSTTTIIETITLPFRVPAPDPTYITPVQPCLLTTLSRSPSKTLQFITPTALTPAPFSETVPGQGTLTVTIQSGALPLPPPNPISVVSSIIPLTSTILVTKKTSVVVVATDTGDPVHYPDTGRAPQPSPTAVSQVPSFPAYSVSADLPPSTKAPQSEQGSSPSSPAYINGIVSSILGGPAPLPKPEAPVQSTPQQSLAPSSPAAANPGSSVVPVAKPGGSSNANNPEGPSSSPGFPSNPDTQGPINAKPGNPSDSDTQQSSAGDSVASPTPSLPDVTTLTIKNIPVVLESGNIVINSQTFNPASPTSIVVNGQSFQIDSSAIIAPGRTIALPPSPTSSVTLAGQVFSIDPARPSQLVGTGGVIDFPQNSQGSAIAVAGQTFTLNPSQIIGAGTTLDLPALLLSSATPTAVAVEGVTVSIGPSLAVIGSSTYSIIPGQVPRTVVYKGQTISIGPGGLGFVGTSIALPQESPTISAVTADNLAFSIGPSVAILSGTTYMIGAGASPTVVTVGGEVLTIGPSGVILPTQTIAPLATVKPSVVTAGGLTFSIEPSAAIISGTTYQIGAGASSTVVTVGGEVLTIGPNGVILPTQTIAPLATVTSSVVTAGDLTFLIEPSAAIIRGTTYQIGAGASSRVLTIEGEVITLGPSGVILPTQTIPPLATVTPLVVIDDSLTFSVEPGDVIISGTAYRIGSGATPTTLLFGTETVRIGPSGIALPSTTISPPSQTASETQTIPKSAAFSRVVWRTWFAIMVTFVGVLISI